MIFHSPYPEIAFSTDQSLTDYVFEHADQWPDKVAIVDGPSGRELTYGQLTSAIRQVATGLAARGFGHGDVFAIYLPNLPEYAIAFHAVAAAGGINTTINPLYTVDELTKQLKDAGAKYLLTIPMFLEKAQAAGAQCGIEEIFVLGEAEGATSFSALMQEGEPPAPPIESATDLVALPYSSGTTGLPKGVMLTHQNLVVNVEQALQLAQVTEDERLIAILPFYHIYGMTALMNLALRQGATLVTMPRFDLAQFLQLMQAHQITRAFLVPPIVLGLAKHPLVEQYDLSALQIITSGAAPLSAEVTRACMKRLGCVINQGYGMTEMSPVTHLGEDGAEGVRVGSIGKLVPGTTAKLVDVATGEAVGHNEEGELLVNGLQKMRGYLNNEEATTLSIDNEGWYHTGDVGYVDDDGFFFIVDRVKELIKYKGMQVAPAELEAVLLTHPSIADAAVIPVADEEAGEIPKAFVVLTGALSTDEVMAYVAERVAPHKRVRRVEVVEEIPKSSSGKILRRLLVEKERAGTGG